MREISRCLKSRQQTPSQLRLPGDGVDVWQVELDEKTNLAPPARILSGDELTRADRYRFARDRLRFIRCRSVLRLLLGRYLDIPAEEIVFRYQRGGKPELASELNRSGLRFNVSHSGGMALLAFAVDHCLGVDIEQMRGDVDASNLAERFFSSRERAGLRALPEELQLRAFFACWTRKEAFIKATGDGLALPLSEFSVTTSPDLDPRLEEVQGDTNARQQWFLADLNAPEGYWAALAVEGATFVVRRFSLEGP